MKRLCYVGMAAVALLGCFVAGRGHAWETGAQSWHKYALDPETPWMNAGARWEARRSWSWAYAYSTNGKVVNRGCANAYGKIPVSRGGCPQETCDVEAEADGLAMWCLLARATAGSVADTKAVVKATLEVPGGEGHPHWEDEARAATKGPDGLDQDNEPGKPWWIDSAGTFTEDGEVHLHLATEAHAFADGVWPGSALASAGGQWGASGPTNMRATKFDVEIPQE